MKTWKEETWRGRVKMIAFALTPVTILVLLCDGLTAAAIRRTFGNEVDPLTGRKTYVFHMGRYPWSHVSHTPINSLGFPDEEFVNLRPKGSCTHIVFVGDSFVFGDGVDRDDNYVSLVRSWSARRFPERCMRFFNIGERATTIEQHARHLEETWDLLEPDVVILGLYQNDLTDLTKDGFAGHVDDNEAASKAGDRRNWIPIEERYPRLGISIAKWVSYRAFALMSERGIHYDILARWSVLADSSNQPLAKRLTKQYGEMFEKTVAHTRARGATIGVTIMPSKFDVLAGRSPEEEFFLGLASRNGVPSLALFSLFDAARSPFPFLLYDGHLNRYGNYLVARAVMSWLFDDQPPPFAALRPQPLTVPRPIPSSGSTR